MRQQKVSQAFGPHFRLHRIKPSRSAGIVVPMKTLNTGECERCGGSLAGLRVDARYCGHRCRLLATKKRIRIRSGSMVGGEERECLYCEAPFTAKSQRNTYCSKACSRASYKARTNTGRQPVICEVCDNTFIPNSSMHKMCSDECLRTRGRHLRLALQYGLTPEAFEALLREQDGGCAICQTQGAERWAVDHDHACCVGSKTCGKCVRGILCFPCNQALGLFRERPNVLARAISYVTGSNKSGQPGSVYR